MPRERWYDSDNPDKVSAAIVIRAVIWVCAALVAAGAISVVVWRWNASVSDVKGASEATQQINSGVNRINAQEWFHSQYGQIQTADRQLDGLAKNLAASVGKDNESFHRTNFTGVQNRCLEMVAVYNAEAQKVSRQQWRDPNLPASIDATDPKTDCKETAVEATP